MNLTGLGSLGGMAVKTVDAVLKAAGGATQVKLPGLNGHINLQSLSFLKGAKNISPKLAEFFDSAVKLGEIFQSHVDGSALIYKAPLQTVAGVPEANGMGLRFEPSNGRANAADGYNLTGVEHLGGSMGSASPRTPPPLPRRPGSTHPLQSPLRPPGLGIVAQLNARALELESAGSAFGSQRTSVPSGPGRGEGGAQSLERSNAFRIKTNEVPKSKVSASPKSVTTLTSRLLTAMAAGPAKITPVTIRTADAVAMTQPFSTEDFFKNFQRTAKPQNTLKLWSELNSEEQAIYKNNEHEYGKQLTAMQTTSSNDPALVAALVKQNMRVVSNNGRTGDMKNNCFLISVLQHAKNDYGPVEVAEVNKYRKQLNDAKLLVPNDPMTSDGEAAKKFIEQINADPNVKQKLNLQIISIVGGNIFVDRLGDQSPDAKEVHVIDSGGHFEPIARIFS